MMVAVREDLPLIEIERYKLASHGRVLVPMQGERDAFRVYELVATRDGWREVLLRYAGRQRGGVFEDLPSSGPLCSPASFWTIRDERMVFVDHDR